MHHAYSFSIGTPVQHHALSFAVPRHAGPVHIECKRVYAVDKGMSLEVDKGKTDKGARVVCWGANYAGQSGPLPESTQRYMVGISVGWEHSVRIDRFGG